jgi:hypothetical protein
MVTFHTLALENDLTGRQPVDSEIDRERECVFDSASILDVFTVQDTGGGGVPNKVSVGQSPFNLQGRTQRRSTTCNRTEQNRTLMAPTSELIPRT